MSPSVPREPQPLSDTIGREILILLVSLAFGFLASPPLLWFVGRRTLGPYAGGNVQALAEHFVHGLAAGSFGFWAVGLAPYLIVLMIRALIAIVRYRPDAQ